MDKKTLILAFMNILALALAFGLFIQPARANLYQATTRRDSYQRRREALQRHRLNYDDNMAMLEYFHSTTKLVIAENLAGTLSYLGQAPEASGMALVSFETLSPVSFDTDDERLREIRVIAQAEGTLENAMVLLKNLEDMHVFRAEVVWIDEITVRLNLEITLFVLQA